MAEKHLYQIVSSQLRQAILSGKYAPDDMIPSENELAEKYGTSRVTIRKSLQVLENEGLIKPWHGKGYFVQQPEHTRFTMHFGDGGGLYNLKFQKITVLPADRELASVLDLPEGKMVVVTRRIMEKEGVPVAYDEKFVPYERGAPSVEMEINYAEFPDMFADKFVPVSIWTDMEIGVEAAPDYACKALGCEKGTPLLTVYRTICTKEGQPIGYGKQYLSKAYGRIKARSGYYVNNPLGS